MRSPPPTRLLFAAALLVVSAGAADVVAQEPSSAEVARARSLFAEGEAAAAAERWSDAIDRFERVRALKETPGVVFHLAAARAGAGQLAVALGLFERSRDLARAARVDEVMTLAEERIAALGHRVPRLIVRIGEGVTEVRLDGRPLAPAQLGAPIRVDPGKHRVEGLVQGAPVVREVDLAEGALLTVPLGTPSSAEPASTRPAAEPAPAGDRPRQTTPATSEQDPAAGPVPVGPLVLGAAGLALAGVGVGVFVAAEGENSAASEACAAGSCDPGARDTVRTLDRVALSMWIGATAALGGAAVWWVLDGGPVGASAGVGPRGATLRGRF